MTEQEILNALEAAKLLNPSVWRIEILMNRELCEVAFYNVGTGGRMYYGSGQGENLDAAITDALWRIV